MKNKNILVLAGVILLVLAAVGFFVYSSKNRQTGAGAKPQEVKVAEEVNEKMAEETEALSGTGSLSDILKRGQNLQCTYYVKGESTLEQSVYILGTKMRTDNTMQVEMDGKPETLSSHMILIGDIAYVWMDKNINGENKGIKIDISQEEAAAEAVSETSEEEAVTVKDTLGDAVDYRCSKWIPDNSKFELPEGIEFVDMQEEMKKLTAPLQGDPALCSACTQMTDETEKAECIKTFGCE